MIACGYPRLRVDYLAWAVGAHGLLAAAGNLHQGPFSEQPSRVERGTGARFLFSFYQAFPPGSARAASHGDWDSRFGGPKRAPGPREADATAVDACSSLGRRPRLPSAKGQPVRRHAPLPHFFADLISRQRKPPLKEDVRKQLRTLERRVWETFSRDSLFRQGGSLCIPC